jgi:pimeloyl-ACP methyl ester carboxylesterase
VIGSARIIGWLALVCAGLSLLLPAGAGAEPAPLEFSKCLPTQIFVAVAGLQCGTLDVSFDRADPAAGSVGLAVQRVPANAPRVGVVVMLAGGPGQPALPAFEEVAALLARVSALRGFELVAFDQRGTGQSQGLQCPDLGVPRPQLMQSLGACGSALGATRAFYTSQESVEDLDALREALGGTPLSLYATSYGGRVAGMYAREHPQGVARMILDSPVPITGAEPLGLPGLRALRRVLNEGICGAGACRSFSGDVYADLVRLVAKLHRRPMLTKIYDDRGRLSPASVTEAGVLRLLTVLDVSLGVRELAPSAIVAASHGDAAPLARLTHVLQAEQPGSGLLSVPAEAAPLAPPLPEGTLVAEPLAAAAPESDAAISLPLFAATYCDESALPWSPSSAPASRAATLRSWLDALPAASTAPFAPNTVVASSALALCMDWPSTPAAPPPPTGDSAIPTLILSGNDDLRTPYEQDLTIAAEYSDAQLLRVPDTGHSTVGTDESGCAKNAMIEFLATGKAPATCLGSKEPQTLPLPPRTLGEVPPLRSRPGLVGRAAAAAAITLEDLYGQPSISGGGLQGGFWRAHGRSVLVHDLVDVRGITISGSIPLGGGTANFTVHGALSGSLTQKGLSLTGRLGGVPVHLHLVAT